MERQPAHSDCENTKTPSKLRRMSVAGVATASSGSLIAGTVWPALRHAEDGKWAAVAVSELMLLGGLALALLAKNLNESGSNSN